MPDVTLLCKPNTISLKGSNCETLSYISFINDRSEWKVPNIKKNHATNPANVPAKSHFI